MNRKKFIELLTTYNGAVVSASVSNLPENFYFPAVRPLNPKNKDGLSADVVICGGGLGGCAAALAALRNNLHRNALAYKIITYLHR